MKYEKEYQELAHNYLCKDEDYYVYRACLAFKDYFYKNINYLEGKKLLEYGCGLGQNIYYLRSFCEVKGYDISKFAVDFCKKKVIDATTKMFGMFDVIFCRHVLEHTIDPYKHLKIIHRHLKKGGILDLILPYERHKMVNFKPDHNGHLYSWNFRCINNLLARTGFKVVKNEVLVERDGYKTFNCDNLATKFAGWIRGCRELRIVAVKK